MRVLLFVETLSVGGLPNYVLDLARALAAAGDTVALAHLGTHVPAHLDVSSIELLGVDAHLPIAGQLPALVQRWCPDIVHVHLCSNSDALNALRHAGVPTVRSFHDYTSLCLRRGRRRYPGDRCQRALGASCALFGCLIGPPQAGSRIPSLMDLPGKLRERAIYQAFSASIVGSEHMRQVLLKNNFPQQHVHRVPYFSRFHAQAEGILPMPPKPLGIPGVDRPLQLLFSGQAVAGKGLRVLVQALAGVQGHWHLTAITSGPELPAVQALAKQLHLEDRIRWMDWLPQEALAQHYRDADVLVLPSVWDDPGPLVGIEAMSFETPVVAFPVGGIPDYVRQGKTGWLTSEATAAALTATLQDVLSHPSRIAIFGCASRELIVLQHTRHTHIHAIQKIYEGALISHALALNHENRP